jgi:hypothetical protein
MRRANLSLCPGVGLIVPLETGVHFEGDGFGLREPPSCEGVFLPLSLDADQLLAAWPPRGSEGRFGLAEPGRYFNVDDLADDLEAVLAPFRGEANLRVDREALQSTRSCCGWVYVWVLQYDLSTWRGFGVITNAVLVWAPRGA